MGWERLAAGQSGVVTRRQLNEQGVDADKVRHRLATGRWQQLTPTVLVTTTGPLDEHQRRWAAVLQPSLGGALAGLTAASVHGLRGWDRPDVSAVMPKDSALPGRLPWASHRRTRRPLESLVSRARSMPTLRLEPAVLLHAAACRSEREARGLLAATVQQRLTTPERLAATIVDLDPLPRSRLLRDTIMQISDGATSAAEMDVARMCREHDLADPLRQVARRDADGRRRFTDCEWHLADGRVVVLEVDGSFHMDVLSWEDDLVRARALARPGLQLVRATARELREDAWRVARDLRRLGVPSR